MRKTLLTLITVVGITSAGARDFESAGVWYTVLDEEQKTCSTREGGAVGDTFSGELKIPEKVSDGSNEYTVTEIGSKSFYGCSFTNRRIVHGEIPATVKRIQPSAFENSNIEYLMLPENGVTQIGAKAFYNNNKDNAIKYAYLPQCVERQPGINKLEDLFNVEYSRLIVAHHPWGCRNSDNEKRVNIIYSECKWDGMCLYSDTKYGRTLQFVSWAAEGTLKVPDTYTNVNGRYGGYENLSTILPRTIEYYDYDRHGLIGNMAAKAYYKYPAGTFRSSIVYYSDKAEIMDNCIYDEINWYTYFKEIDKGWNGVLISQYGIEDKQLALTNYIPNQDIKSLIYTTYAQPEEFKIKEGTEIIINSFKNSKNLKAVKMPSTVKYLYDSFINIETLTQCSLSSKMTMICSGFSYIPNLTEIKIPETVKYLFGFKNCGIEEVNIPDNIVLVDAFDGYYENELQSLKKVTFGKNIKYIIGFNNITAETITIPEGTQTISGAFATCPNLSYVTLPESLKCVYAGFCNNPRLEHITIPASVETFVWGTTEYPKTMYFQSKRPPINRIGDNPEGQAPTSGQITCIVPDGSLETYAESAAFHYMNLMTESGLKPLKYNDDVFDYLLFSETKEAMITGLTSQSSAVSIPNRIPVESETGVEFYPVTTIGVDAFMGKKQLQKIELPSSLRYIGNQAFRDCSSLRDIKFPTQLKGIGCYAFYNCQELKEATFYNALNQLDVDAFGYCINLRKVSFSEGPDKIGRSAFEHCSLLTEVQLPTNLRNINQYAFQYTGLENLDMRNTQIDIIEDYAFLQCKMLNNVIFPTTLKKLGHGSFASCIELKEAELPEKLSYIGANSFYNTVLKEVIIPASVEKLCMNAFKSCKDIEYIKLCDSEQPLIPVKEGYGTSSLIINNPWADLEVFEGCKPSRLYLGRPTGSYAIEPDTSIEDGELKYSLV